MPRNDVQFRAEVPNLPNIMPVCSKWINTKGVAIATTETNVKFVTTFTTSKVVRQCNLLRSLRMRLSQNGFGYVVNDVRVFCAGPPRPHRSKASAHEKEMSARIAQLEAALASATVEDSDTDTTDTDTASDTSSDSNDTSSKNEDVVPQPVRSPKLKISAYVRQLVWNQNCGERNGLSRCWCCDLTTIGGTSGWDCGHIVAKSRGGSDALDNLRPICRGCNGAMGVENMLDFQRRHFPARHALLHPS